MSFEYPFLYFNLKKINNINYGIKPVVIIYFMILIFLNLIPIFSNNEIVYKKTFNFKSKPDEKNCDSDNLIKKNKIIVCFFILLFAILNYCLSYSSLLTDKTLVKDNIIFILCQKFLKYETFLIIILGFTYLCGFIIIKKNKYTFLNFLNKWLIVFMIISIFTTLSTKQIEINNDTLSPNIVLLIILLLTIYMLFAKSFKKEEENIEKNIFFFLPVLKYDDLFNKNKIIAERLKKFIIQQSSEPISICVSGRWGAGKTSVINGALDLIKKEEKEDFVIKINALELDDASSLFKYFFDKIGQFLHEVGAYKGISSEYKQFIATSLGIITDSRISDLLSLNLFNKNKDYRDMKVELENLIVDALGNKKIIVVIDDIERCTSEKAKEFIFFVKEVASFRNCVVIFATDLDILYKLCSKEAFDETFFDKFFNYRLDISDIDYEEITNFYKSEIDKFNRLNKIYEFDLYSIIECFENKFKEKIEKIKESKKENDSDKAENILKLNNQLKFFLKNVRNPRKMIKIIKSYLNYLHLLEKEYNPLIDNRQKELKVYLSTIQANKLLFIISYIEVCFYNEYNDIKNEGIKKYIDNIKTDDIENKLFIKEICKGILFEDEDEDEYYRIKKSIKFIDVLIGDYRNLNRIVNGYTKKEEEWFNAIEKNELVGYKSEIKEIVLTVMNEFSQKDENKQKGREYLKKILEFLRNSDTNDKTIANNTDTDIFDYIFSIRDSEIQDFTKLHVMDIVLDGLNWNELESYLSEDSIEKFKYFSEGYCYYTASSICNILYYFTDEKVTYEYIKGCNDEVFNKNNAKEALYSYLKKLNELLHFSNNIEQNKIIENLKSLRNYIIDNIKQYKIDKYDDVKKDMENLESIIQDIEYFLKITEFVENSKLKEEYESLGELRNDNINEYIKYFRNKIYQFDVITYGKFSDEFNDFFNKLRNSNIDIDSNNIVELHQLVSEYLKKSVLPSRMYRKILIDLANKGKK